MENDKTLKTRTRISQSSDPIHANLNLLFSDGVMPTSIIVGSIFFPSNKLFGMEQLAIGACTNLIYNNLLKTCIL